MVDLALFSDWTYCNACGLPPTAETSATQSAATTTSTSLSSSAKTKKLMACSDCSCVAYHNATCQKSSWKSCHKRECKELSRAILPLKQLIQFNKMRKKIKKSSINKMDSDDIDDMHIDVVPIWCWWEADNENGITQETLSNSNSIWECSSKQWHNGDYLNAMAGFQQSLEPYRIAWPYVSQSSGTNEKKRGNDKKDFFERSFTLAKKLLFCAYCELDAQQIDSARQRLVQCLSITLTVFFTTPSRTERDLIRKVMNDSWMELMLSYEEVPQHRIIAKHVANMAIATKSCAWTDALQRPGYMKSGLSSLPYTPSDKHPPWCRILEQNWIRILNEYHTISSNPLNLSNVGSGQRGSGYDDHTVVAGTGQYSWKEYVLFGSGSNANDSDAPFTKQLLRQHCLDAVTLATQGGGEVIFSKLAPKTHIKSHCGPTNLRTTAHLGLVVPNSSSDCQIRVRDKWHSWSAGKVLMFDDSFEHEVKNDTDETRVVLLIRSWHPDIPFARRSLLLNEAMSKKEEAVRKRYDCNLSA